MAQTGGTVGIETKKSNPTKSTVQARKLRKNYSPQDKSDLLQTAALFNQRAFHDWLNKRSRDNLTVLLGVELPINECGKENAKILQALNKFRDEIIHLKSVDPVFQERFEQLAEDKHCDLDPNSPEALARVYVLFDKRFIDTLLSKYRRTLHFKDLQRQFNMTVRSERNSEFYHALNQAIDEMAKVYQESDFTEEVARLTTVPETTESKRSDRVVTTPRPVPYLATVRRVITFLSLIRKRFRKPEDYLTEDYETDDEHDENEDPDFSKAKVSTRCFFSLKNCYFFIEHMSFSDVAAPIISKIKDTLYQEDKEDGNPSKKASTLSLQVTDTNKKIAFALFIKLKNKAYAAQKELSKNLTTATRSPFSFLRNRCAAEVESTRTPDHQKKFNGKTLIIDGCIFKRKELIIIGLVCLGFAKALYSDNEPALEQGIIADRCKELGIEELDLIRFMVYIYEKFILRGKPQLFEALQILADQNAFNSVFGWNGKSCEAPAQEAECERADHKAETVCSADSEKGSRHFKNHKKKQAKLPTLSFLFSEESPAPDSAEVQTTSHLHKNTSSVAGIPSGLSLNPDDDKDKDKDKGQVVQGAEVSPFWAQKKPVISGPPGHSHRKVHPIANGPSSSWRVFASGST